jgi:putative redox protein
MPLDHLEITCSGEQDQDPPWTFRKIHLRFIVGGKNLTEKAVAQAIQLSEEKYCSVAATVRATAQITTEFEILEEEPCRCRDGGPARARSYLRHPFQSPE